MTPAVRILNRRVHIYAGLALLLFVMLFAGTGMILNRHWAFTEFWPDRRISTEERDFAPPAAGMGDVAAARQVMAELGLRGEVSSTEVAPDRTMTIQAARPGENLKVTANLAAGHALVERTRVNGWGVVRTLHTFIGVSQADPLRRRDWWLTSLWSLAIDLTSLGLILLVLGGLVEAWAANPRRLPLVLTFLAGAVLCGAFVAGLIA